VSEPEVEPSLRILRGHPDADELAALAALIAAAAGSGEPDPAKPTVRGGWSDPAQLVRRSWPSGPGGWRAAR